MTPSEGASRALLRSCSSRVKEQKKRCRSEHTSSSIINGIEAIAGHLSFTAMAQCSASQKSTGGLHLPRKLKELHLDASESMDSVLSRSVHKASLRSRCHHATYAIGRTDKRLS